MGGEGTKEKKKFLIAKKTTPEKSFLFRHSPSLFTNISGFCRNPQSTSRNQT
jgi:hypothetical protein